MITYYKITSKLCCATTFKIFVLNTVLHTERGGHFNPSLQKIAHEFPFNNYLSPKNLKLMKISSLQPFLYNLPPISIEILIKVAHFLEACSSYAKITKYAANETDVEGTGREVLLLARCGA
jgi:hypothetical protein